MENGVQLWNKDEHGLYWLLFPNKFALSKMHIRQIFSSFGNVGNIRVAGDEKGLHFVQYTSLAEVEKAIAGLTNHPTIRLLPIRPKKKDNQNSNTVSKNKENGNSPKQPSPNEKRNFFQRKQSNNSDVTVNSKSNAYAEHLVPKINDSDKRSMCKVNNPEYLSRNHNSSTCSNNSTTNKKDMFGKSLLNDHAFSQTLPKNDIENSSAKNSVGPETKTLELLKLRGINATNFSLPKSNYNNANSNIVDNCKDNIPDLVTNNKVKSFNEVGKKDVNAEEIIVGNIHKDYSSAYILHLFEQFEPIAVSYTKTLPKTDIQYCYVYFKTAHDSIEVEKKFDRYNLAGKSLVVLRPCRLMEEAAHKH